MVSKPTITSPNHEWEMSSWCVEKANQLVRDLAYAINSDERSECRNNLSAALYNATKLLAFITGCDWSPNDVDTIAQHGSDGYEEIAVKYGILERTQKQQMKLNQQQGIERLRELISGPVSPSRTLCHELLLLLPDTPVFSEFADSLERVTIGSMQWADFQKTASGILDRAPVLSDDS